MIGEASIFVRVSSRWVAIDAILLDDDWVISSSACHIEINLRKFPEVYLRCELEGLSLGFVHSHPDGLPEFSLKDDQNERNILRGYGGCNGPDVALVCLVRCAGEWIGKVRTADKIEVAIKVRHVAVLGQKLELHLRHDGPRDAALERQEAAFGAPFNAKLRSLRVGVVGLGGTGSPIATLLSRAGVGELLLIDGDVVEATNLNRVRGYTRGDIGQPKAATLEKFIRGVGMYGAGELNIALYLREREVD